MTKSLRLALVAGACVVAVALTGASFGAHSTLRTAAPAHHAFLAYGPTMLVEQSSYKLGAPFTADIFVAAPEADDPSASLIIFSPAGYGVNLAKTPGTSLGSAVAVISAGQLGGAHLTLRGTVVVANPTDPQVMATSQRCTGSPSNQLVIALNLSLQGQTVPFLVFVNKVGPLTKFQICVPHPDVAPFGARVLALDATLAGVFTNPTTANGYEWSTLFTPYDATTKLPNPGGTIEVRTYVGLPSSLTLKKVKATRGFKLTGQLRIKGLDTRGIRLNLYAGKKARPAPTATTSGTGKRIARSSRLPLSGKYSIARPNVKVATYFQTRFENYTTDCIGPSPSGQPFPCREEWVSALTSNQVKATKPRKRR